MSLSGCLLSNRTKAHPKSKRRNWLILSQVASYVQRDTSQPSTPVGRASCPTYKAPAGRQAIAILVSSNKCRVWKLDLQAERSEIPIYRGCLATCVILKKSPLAYKIYTFYVINLTKPNEESRRLLRSVYYKILGG